MTPVRVGYFGKLPAHSDFIKASDHPALVGLLDHWLAGVMNALIAEPRWKLHYDALPPLHFAFVGTRSKRCIAGRLVASRDQSQRRFPFLTMSTIAVDAPAAFLAACPLALHGLWRWMAQQGAAVLAQPDPAAALQALASSVVDIDADPALHAARWSSYLAAHTLGKLAEELSAAGFRTPLAHLLLAVGLLLEPLRTQVGRVPLKGLRLPLPRGAAERCLAASLWLQLVLPFLITADWELALFITDAAAPHLVIGFCGAAPQTLRAIVDPAFGAGQLIGFEECEWVAEQVRQRQELTRLATYLAQPALTLEAALGLFEQTFV